MATFTMPVETFVNPPSTGGENRIDKRLVNSGGLATTITASWTSNVAVTFQGYFVDSTPTPRNFVGFQNFAGFTSGSFTWSDSAFNGVDNWSFGFQNVTVTGTINFTFSTTNGRPYSGVYTIVAGVWKFCPVFSFIAGAWKFCSVYFFNGTSWRLHHS